MQDFKQVLDLKLQVKGVLNNFIFQSAFKSKI